jgi:pimeloyl-ACP methyl ester carboxylesterase
VVTERDLTLGDGRTLRVHDGGGDERSARGSGFAVLWHHGSPQTGALLPPLLEATARRGLRLVAYGRPSYGGSTPAPGRSVADAAGDVEQLADALGLERFSVMGASGGGPHALACAAGLPERVTAVACLASPAPYTEAFDWFDGMVDPSGLRAAREGREARARHAETAEFVPSSFTDADWAALEAEWAALGQDAMRAGQAGPDGAIDDDVAFASPWGFDLDGIETPVLLAQGGEDRVIPPSHAYALLRALPRPELWLRPLDGHVSILRACPLALDWLRFNAR